MSEHDWTATPVPPTNPEVKYEAVVDGLTVTVTSRPDATSRGATPWAIRGYLGDIVVHAYSGQQPGGYGVPLDDAKAAGLAAAHRLYAAGVRGEKSYPVSCCERTFATKAVAEEHEGKHKKSLVHFGGPGDFVGPDGIGCDAWRNQWNSTTDPAAVTCPACREWVSRNVPPVINDQTPEEVREGFRRAVAASGGQESPGLADIASSLPRQDIAPTLRFYADDTTVKDRHSGQVIEEHETVEGAEAHVARLAELDARRIAREQAGREAAESEGGVSGEEPE